MKRYKPLEKSIEVPYVPEGFIAAVADLVEVGELLPRPHPVEVRVQAQRENYLRIRVSEESEVLVLRFDTMEIWRENDHTIRYRVAYRGWFRARLREARCVGFMHVVAAALGGVLVIAALFMPEVLGQSIILFFGLGSDFIDEPRPQLRILGERLKAVATVETRTGHNESAE